MNICDSINDDDDDKDDDNNVDDDDKVDDVVKFVFSLLSLLFSIKRC